LLLIPGSQRFYVSCSGKTPPDHFKSSLQKQELGVPDDDSLHELASRGGIVTATGKPGSVIVFDSNTMHGSNGNITPFPRSNVFFVFQCGEQSGRQAVWQSAAAPGLHLHPRLIRSATCFSRWFFIFSGSRLFRWLPALLAACSFHRVWSTLLRAALQFWSIRRPLAMLARPRADSR